MLALTQKDDQLLCKMLKIRQDYLKQAVQNLNLDRREGLIELLSNTLNNLESSLKEGKEQNE